MNLSGGGGRSYLLYASGYASSKAGVLRLTEQIARELKDQEHDDILAFAINPGLVKTEVTKFQAESPQGQRYIPSTKESLDQGLVRQPEECGHLCAWLAERRPKEFSGRSFYVMDDLEELWKNKEELAQQDLRVLREKR